jgi:hypothetical protein
MAVPNLYRLNKIIIVLQALQIPIRSTSGIT